MKHFKLFEQFVNENLNLSSADFAKYIIDTVAKKYPWAEVTKQELGRAPYPDSITFDGAVEIYWMEGPDNQTNSMIGVVSKGKWQRNSDRPTFGPEIQKTTKWNRQDIGVKNLLAALKTNSSNSPVNN
jgi:hypothetical protein